jgi:hypothetical protein
VDLKTVNANKFWNEGMRVERKVANMQGPEERNSINLCSHQFIKSISLVDVQGELFARVVRHDDIHPRPRLRRDESKDEKVANV